MCRLAVLCQLRGDSCAGRCGGEDMQAWEVGCGEAWGGRRLGTAGAACRGQSRVSEWRCCVESVGGASMPSDVLCVVLTAHQLCCLRVWLV